jgi:predicted AlkP superfamily pyrophosphatase or phosphodiesterase
MKKSKLTALVLSLLLSINLFSQIKKPRLVVGIIVDQMRNDYIYRYWDRFSSGGFKRLVGEGFYFRNAHYNYVPTYTGPGHSSVYTGASPRVHGIIGNDWYVKKSGSWTNCIHDTTVKTIGAEGKTGQASPKNQLSSTIGDELKISQPQSKVFAVALKDRSAILPAGHAADGAFWYDDVSGNFISSSFYTKSLPDWLNAFNAQKLTATYLAQNWNTLYPISTYSRSLPDENRYEGAVFNNKKVFPYDLTAFIEKKQWSIIKLTPYGNTITKDIAIKCIEGEKLGADDECDLLSISFSSPDIVGHTFGPRSVEIEDVYLRLDQDISALLSYLDTHVGKGNYSVFLTADHGAADVPNHLKDHQVPAGYVNEKKMFKDIRNFFQANYGDSMLMTGFSNNQVYLNEPRIYELKQSKQEVEERLCGFLLSLNGVAEAYPSSVIRNGSFPETDLRYLIQNGYNHLLSGNVCFIYKPSWMDYAETGTTHGEGYNYDTHVPVIFFGSGVRKGESLMRISITQIAPSVCELMKINQPSGCFSEPLNDHFR